MYSLMETSLFTGDFKRFSKKASVSSREKVALILQRLICNPREKASQKSGDLQGLLTQRIDDDNRLMYSIDETLKVVKLLGIGTHDHLYSSERKKAIRKKR